MEFAEIVQWAKDICSIATCAALLVKPVREWLMGDVCAEMIPGRGGIGLYSWGVHVDVGKYSRWNG